MHIDRLAIYKYTRDHEHKKKPLLLENHLVNDESMDAKKIANLLESLAEAWNCNFMDLQIQARFVPTGTDSEEQ